VKFKEMLIKIRPTEFIIYNASNVATTTVLDGHELNRIYVEIFRNNQLEKFSFDLKADIPEDLLEATFIKMRVELQQRQTNAYMFFCSFVFSLIV
jgi:hypothetical protein